MQQTVTATLERYLTFPIQGVGWPRRFVTGSGLVLASYFVPIVPMLFVYGYTLRIMQASLQGQELTMPAWIDWGKLGVDGLRLSVISLAFSLPGLIVLAGGVALYVASMSLWPSAVALRWQGNSATGTALILVGLLSGMGLLLLTTLLGTLLIVAGGIVLPSATAHFVAKDRLVAAFRVREWWPLLRRNPTGYLSAWVIVFGLAAAVFVALNLSYYTIVLCCLIPFIGSPLTFYVMVVSAALFGETYRDSVARARALQEPSAG
jgi:hypothetical protein